MKLFFCDIQAFWVYYRNQSHKYLQGKQEFEQKGKIKKVKPHLGQTGPHCQSLSWFL